MPTMARCDHGEYIATHAGIYFESICLVLCSFLASPNCAGKFSKVISSDKFSGTASERRVAAVRGARVQCCYSLGKYNITFHLFFFFVRWQPQVKNTWPIPLAPLPFNAEHSVCIPVATTHTFDLTFSGFVLLPFFGCCCCPLFYMLHTGPGESSFCECHTATNHYGERSTMI